MEIVKTLQRHLNFRKPSISDQASDLWQQLELASELESDLRDTGLGQKVACLF